MSDLDAKTIQSIKARFDKCAGHVSCAQFIEIIVGYLPLPDSTGDGQQRTRLAELFTEIDINNDQEVSWEEFTGYLIKHGIQVLDQRDDDDGAGTHKRYVECELAHEITFCNLEKLYYFGGIDRLVTCDHSRIVKLYKPLNAEHQKQDFALAKELHGHSGAILAAEFIGALGMLCTSSTDSTMLFWDSTANYRRKSEILTAHPQLCLSWSASHAVLYTGSTSGDVHLWVYKDAQWRNTSVLKGHEDMVMDIVIMANTSLMASASLDSKIIVWEVNTGTFHQQVQGHSKGVLSLAYEPEHRLLFSSGFDRDVLVWNPWILAGGSSSLSAPESSVAHPLVFRLKGHHTSPITLRLIDGSSQLVSADADGVFKVWDVRRLECVQTFETTSERHAMVSFTYAASRSQIIAGTRILHTFQWDRPGKPWLSSSQPLVAAIYSELSGTILTAAGRELRIWHAQQGRLLRLYSNVTAHKISAVCLDAMQRKVIVGTTKGQVQLFNYNTGALLAELEPHAGEVAAVAAARGRTLISAGWDSCVRIHHETLPVGPSAASGSSVVRSVQCQRDAVACAYSDSCALFACADAANTVRVWDFDSASSEHVWRLEHEVTCIAFAASVPVLVAADSAGGLHLCAVRPAPLKNRLLCTLVNTASSSSSDGVGSEHERDGDMHQPIDSSVRVGSGLPASVDLPSPPAANTSSTSPAAALVAAASDPSLPLPPASVEVGTGVGAGVGVPVGAMAFSSKHQLLVTGDEHGVIKVWSCARLFAKANLTQAPDGHTRQLLTKSRGAPGSLPNQAAARGASDQTAAAADDVTLCVEWRAHASSISSLQLISDVFILSASRDRRVCSWDLSGRSYGTLQQAGDGHWTLPLVPGKPETRSAPATAKQHQQHRRAAAARRSTTIGRRRLSLDLQAARDEPLLPSIRGADDEPGDRRVDIDHDGCWHDSRADLAAVRRRPAAAAEARRPQGHSTSLPSIMQRMRSSPAIVSNPPAASHDVKQKKDEFVSFSAFLSDVMQARGMDKTTVTKRSRQLGETLFDKLSQLT
eukprot:TRINITY_DN430_c2_g1_i6.p1 TRINITY_DN430_c2_g1~~TRINITY_DN430_c2_g1_i6.p1  ORF type:complete len:1041 (+),score=393.32 TRINITY_DN430_c2_g1_i6:312-3434(+)